MGRFMKSFIPRRQFKHNPARFNVLSSGGGTQSNAMICLIHAGVLPKPDVIVMSDTEREASNVFAYQAKHIKALCDEVGIEYHIVPKSLYATYDIVGPDEDEPLPGYFSTRNGRDANGWCTGKKPTFCSVKWKQEVVQRFLNDKYGEKFLTARGVDMWMGISIEEAARRMKVTDGKWRRRYPLIDMMLTKQMCIQCVEDYGLPTPPASLIGKANTQATLCADTGIEIIGWSGFDASDLNAKSHRVELARFIAAADPETILAILAELEAKDEALRELAFRVSAGGYNADSVDAEEFKQKIIDGINSISAVLIKRIDELEAVKADASQVFKEIGNELGCNPDNESIMMAIDELKKRLATPVRLPKRWDVSGQVNPPRIVEVQFEQQNRTHDQCAKAIRDAGFKVDGDE